MSESAANSEYHLDCELPDGRRFRVDMYAALEASTPQVQLDDNNEEVLNEWRPHWLPDGVRLSRFAIRKLLAFIQKRVQSPAIKRSGVECARLVRYYHGHDCWPDGVSGAYKRYWVRAAEPILRARDRIASGEVATEDLYELALYAFDSEEVAAQCLTARLESLNRQKTLRGGE